MTVKSTNPIDRVFSYPDMATAREGVVATYAMECDAGEDVWARAAGLAVGQSVGTWTPVPGVDEAMLARHLGEVIAAYEMPPRELRTQVDGGKRSYVIQIAYPEINYGPQMPLLMTVLLGNDVSTSAQVKLLDVSFSRQLVAALHGPRYGIAGIRARLGVPARPLLLNIIKPNIGFDAETGAEMFAAAAMGGCDIIKDDELLGNTSFSASVARVEAYRRAAVRVEAETGHRALYCVNVTDRPDRMLAAARRAVELGVDMIMINAIACGLGALQAAAEDESIAVPILAHYAGSSAMTEATGSGIASPLLLGKLMRLAGADAASFNSPYSVYPLLPERYRQTARNLTMPLHDVLRTLPVPGGGIHPATAVQIIRDLGQDVLLAVGGAVQGHPQGATAGARAMRQAINAAVDGASLADRAKQYEELGVAVAKWGAGTG